LTPASPAIHPQNLIAEALRGGDAQFPADASPAFPEAVVRHCALHGVTALLDHALSQRRSESWPGDLRATLRDSARQEAARELLIEAELERLVAKLAAEGVRALLFKGAPLAYTIYPEAYLRPRCDTDILVPYAQREQADSALRAAGYRPDEHAAGGELASSERMYTREVLKGLTHVVDLHWRLSNMQAYAQALDFETLAADAMPVPRLGPATRMPGLVHGLLIACLHRTTNLHPPHMVDGLPHVSGNRLIWLYDIHRLAGLLSDADWERFTRQAADAGLRAVCVDGLRAAHARFGTALPDAVVASLSKPGSREVSAGHLKPGRWRKHIVDLRALPGWRQRLQLLREWVFPPAEYMLRKYGTTARALLPWLYLRRVVTGIWRSRQR
jgi:hypothetical protein